MSMVIGRCSINEDPYAESLQVSGRTVSFASDINAASVTELKAKMQQLQGLIFNRDEDVFPFTWSEDSSFDGFYRIRSLDMTEIAVSLTTGACPFSIEMERVEHYANPLFEIVTSIVERTNPWAMLVPLSAMAIPAVNEYAWNTINSTALRSIEGAVNGIRVLEQFLPYSGTALQAAAVWYPTAAGFYSGACTVEIQYGGSGSYYPVVGSRIPVTASTNWRISNGLFRVGDKDSAGTNAGSLKTEAYDGANWDEVSYKVGTGGGGVYPAGAAGPIQILRNSPECVIVRRWIQSAANNDRILQTIKLDRGMFWCDMTIQQGAVNGGARDWRVQHYVPDAGTAIAGGVVATANDANGNRYQLMSPAPALTTVAASGRITYTATAALGSFMLGTIVGGGAPTYTWGDSTNQAEQYLLHPTTRQRMVVR